MSGPFFAGYDAWKTRDDNAPSNDNIPEMTFDDWLYSVDDQLINDEYPPLKKEDLEEAWVMFDEGAQPEDAVATFKRREDRLRELAYCAWPDVEPSPEHGLS